MGVQQILSQPDIRTEILSHLTLPEVQALRGVSKDCRENANNYKHYVVQRIQSEQNLRVLIVGLTSEKGKLLNGRIGKVDTAALRKRREGDCRFPIGFNANWLSEDGEVMRIKLSNIHPLFHQPNLNDNFACPPELTSYTNNSKIRECHGRLLHCALGLAKWFVSVADGDDFPGDVNDFLGLSLSHPISAEWGMRMFDYWRQPPFRCSRSSEKLGSALDYVVGTILFNHNNSLEEGSRYYAQYGQIIPEDGKEGQHMMRNMFHCMKTWKEESVTGGFWVTDIYNTGTVMVHLSDLNDPASFSTVYLVKGHNDRIGDLLAGSDGQLRRPAFCQARILPLYDFWTYDGLVIPGRYDLDAVGGVDFESSLRQHVQIAIYSRSVCWRGPSAEQGLWKFDENHPPNPQLIESEDHSFVCDWQDGSTHQNVPALSFEFTDQEWDISRQIAKRAVELGGVSSELSAITMRRFGYSQMDNPNGLVTMWDSRAGGVPLHCFHFEVTDDMDVPSYTLKDALQEILSAMEKASPLPLVQIIMIDDRSLLPRLDAIMEQTFEEVDLIAPTIQYYGIGT